MPLLNTSWHQNAGPNTILYTYSVMIHFNSRILDEWLLLKDDAIVIIWGEIGVGRGNSGKGSPWVYETVSWKTKVKKKKAIGNSFASARISTWVKE